MNLGERIYELRTQAHISQGELADALDISRQSVSKWENNNAVPELDKLIKMAEHFNISLDELVDMEPPAAPSAATVQFPTRRFLGIALAVAGLLFLPFSLLASHSDAQAAFLILGGFLLISGLFCLALPYPYIGIGWAGLGAAALLFFCLTPRWEREYVAQALIWLGAAAMVCLTVLTHRRGKCRIPTLLWWLGGAVLFGLAVLYCLNIIPR